VKPLVLCYHAVTDAWDDPLAVRSAAFERQVRALLRGRRAGTAAEVAAGRGVLHVTFDDAYVSVGDAVATLERLGIPATVFACSGYGDGRALEIEELAGARHDAAAMRTLTCDELLALAERGVEIGSHTVTHAHLTRLGDDELDRELREAKQTLEDALRRPCRFLAYPYGEQDARVRAAAARAGYEAAFGLPGRAGDRYALPRVGIYRKDAVWRAALKAATRSLPSRADR
jgi:peptidoglycan/xylan/chitin deacetylase (PgdA/CDA1 family)